MNKNNKNNVQDFYFKKAKQLNFAARSVFKLKDLDQHFSLIAPSSKILDLGCSPGSWLQYASRRINNNGFIVGVDIMPIKVRLPLEKVYVIKKNVFELKMSELGLRNFDLVLSDMAPSTTGVKSLDHDLSLSLCKQALKIAANTLVKNGRFCVKLLEGEGIQKMVSSCEKYFDFVKLRKPKATKTQSKEIYIVGIRRKA